MFFCCLGDNTYRADLDVALLANRVLAYQQKAEQNALVAQSERDSPGAFPFQVGSYNSGRPYEIAIVAPPKETVGLKESLDFSAARINQLLYDGCVAADGMMHNNYHLESMLGACDARFHHGVKPTNQVRVAATAH